MLKQGCAVCQGGVDQQESGIFDPFGLDCHTGFFDQGGRILALVNWLALLGLSASDKREAVRDTIVLQDTSAGVTVSMLHPAKCFSN